MKQAIKKIVSQSVAQAFPNIEMPDFSVEEADDKFGDYATNAAMILAKRTGDSPQNVAQKIIANIVGEEIIKSAEVAGPGFINFKISIPYLNSKIAEIIEAGAKFAQNDLGKDLKVNIEFISANPTGPLTVGNSRGGVIGDVLANVFTANGAQVVREYYFNDAGGQIDVLGHSILKDDLAQYRGDYIDKLHADLDDGDYRVIGRKAAQIIISEIKTTTQKMGINFDVWFAEDKDLRKVGKVDDIVKWLKDKGLAYEKDGALWFRATKFGDDKDRVLIRSSGEPTYFALDCAYHKNKLMERKFDRVIDIWGADHHGDVARIKGFAEALGCVDKFEIIMHQFVRIVAGGKEVRMSKRAGNYITVDDLLAEVGKDVYRFFMLGYAADTHLTFDLDLAKERSQKNPVYYVQYAYARIASILRKSQILNPKSQTNSQLLNNPEELELIKKLIGLPDLIEEIVGDYQVQKLPFYAVKLADAFHRFYENCPVLQAENDELKAARLKLLKATQIVLKNTLALMGISAPEKM